MSKVYLLGLFLLSVGFSGVMAQEAAKRPDVVFSQVDVETETELIKRDPRALLETLWHAKTGKFGIFEFDADLLRRGRGEIEFDFFGDTLTFKTTEFKPLGYRHPSSGFWYGETAAESKGDSIPNDLAVYTMAIAANGDWVTPDPNREAALAAVAAAERGEPAVMSQTSIERLDEPLVTEINGVLQYRLADGRIVNVVVSQNAKLPGHVILREIDGDKSTTQGDSAYEKGSPGDLRRLEALAAKDAYMQQVDSDIASGVYDQKPQRN